MNDTPLDQAHGLMDMAPDEDAPRLHFYERLAAAELYLLLEGEPDGDKVTPRVFPVEGGEIALAFDLPDRMAEFVGETAPFVAMSGRLLAGLLAGNNLGLGLNLGVAPSSIIVPQDALTWLAETIDQQAQELHATPSELSPPKGLPEVLLTALDAKLATAEGLAKFAYLCSVTYSDSSSGHMLAFVDPLDGAEQALINASNEALIFSGIEAGSLDVTFFNASDSVAARIARVGLRFDLPQVEPRPDHAPKPPGMSPEKPPLLR